MPIDIQTFRMVSLEKMGELVRNYISQREISLDPLHRAHLKNLPARTIGITVRLQEDAPERGKQYEPALCRNIPLDRPPGQF